MPFAGMEVCHDLPEDPLSLKRLFLNELIHINPEEADIVPKRPESQIVVGVEIPLA